MFALLKSMNNEVKMCLKHLGSVSDFFNSDLGLFQRDITSPICFSLFLNDTELKLQENINGGINSARNLRADHLSPYVCR
jgi:hypothetical protein